MSGTTPRVWAPRAHAVSLALDTERRPMRPVGGDWFEADLELPPGARYGFALDGGDEVLPDPRSPSQPDGVHGRSATVDHEAFAWTDAGWHAPALRDAVIYELHVGTFSEAGTFDGAVGHLDDLVDLGVTHLELMPVVEFSGDRGWGYDGVDLFAPHHAYGGPEGLRRLVDAAHARGLAVLLDVVYNHLGPEGNYLERFGPYFTERHHTPWGPAVNFDDRGSHEVRRFVVDNAVGWLRDYHVDGLRIDAMQAIVDMSAVHIGEELTAAVHALGEQLGRPLVVTAESDLNDPKLVRPVRLGGYDMDAAWADDVHHAFHVALSGEQHGYYADFTDEGALARALAEPYLYDDRFSAARGRRHGRPAGDIAGNRFIACLQNHDQVGNRARGERLAHLVSDGRARIGAALLLTAPYVPLLFAGEEWGATTPFLYFSGHEDQELARTIVDARLAEFAELGWDPAAISDPQDPATVEACRLDWSERRAAPHDSLLEWYRACIALRRSEPALRDGDRSAVVVDGDATGRLIVRRGPIAVAVNLGQASVADGLEGRVRLAWPPELATVDGAERRLPPDGVIIVDDR
jgi:maltooligosyltrehalose trehalohydrolase